MKKHLKIIIGVIITLIAIILTGVHVATAVSRVCIEDPHCGYFLPFWLVNLIMPLLVIGLIMLTWGILEKIAPWIKGKFKQ